MNAELEAVSLCVKSLRDLVTILEKYESSINVTAAPESGASSTTGKSGYTWVCGHDSMMRTDCCKYCMLCDHKGLFSE